MRLKVLVVGFGMFVVLTGNVFPQEKISGYMFGDFYYVAANHNKDLQDQNGFWFRRIYFTYDQALSENFDIRFRIEMNSAGDFTTKTKLNPFVKDAYLKWKRDRHSIIFGISPTPTWDVIERVWGYRSVEKTPLDLQKFGSSRDFGLAFKGSLDSGKRVNYHFMIANGGGTSSENNAGKKILFSLSAKLNKNIIVEGYADFEERPGRTNRNTLQGFAAYQHENFRIGVQFAHQNRQVAQGVDDLKLQILSVFAAAKLSERTWGFARIDRTFDPNPDGVKISYIPFDATAESTFLLAGLDFRPIKNVHLMPNVEAVFYDENDASVSPDTDVIPRVTFYYIWK
jgi:hypothetical protein